MKKRFTFSLGVAVLLGAYLAAYLMATERYSGRARGAGVYLHYRIFAHSWQKTIFRPLCAVEATIIRIYPRPFAANPSWAELPQFLVIQTPEGSLLIP